MWLNRLRKPRFSQIFERRGKEIRTKLRRLGSVVSVEMRWSFHELDHFAVVAALKGVSCCVGDVFQLAKFTGPPTVG
jgi:hypothetical protein